jgi:hypothetical protein
MTVDDYNPSLCLAVIGGRSAGTVGSNQAR